MTGTSVRYPMLVPGNTIGLVSCSNGLPRSFQSEIETLKACLSEMGLHTKESPFLYTNEQGATAAPADRAAALMSCFRDPSIDAVFDLSGGDLANSILEYLDYKVIAENSKPFFGLSDLSTVLNALYTKAGTPVFYYQLRNLVREETGAHRDWFRCTILGTEPFPASLPLTFLQGDAMEGEVLGGNVRCFLKLAGTPYMPDLRNKILFLEACSGKPAFLESCLTQYRQLGIFRQVKGILIGQFTELSKLEGRSAAGKLIQKIVQDPNLPIAVTSALGHGKDAFGLPLGTPLRFEKTKHK